MLDSATRHLIDNVLPSADDYIAAEQALSQGYAADATPAAWETAARNAKLQAAHLAIAIDGLPDRCQRELGISKPSVHMAVEALCV